MAAERKRILSGIKPSAGATHLGNYFAMIVQALELQHQGDAYFFVADLHALNQIRHAASMRANVRGILMDYLACGLDPKICTVFRQSDIPEVAELQWILGTLTPMGLLQRGHAYKDATSKGELVDFGLFAYPVLMAADILLYSAHLVPVGQDQIQHIEITRDIAVKFNLTYCKSFDAATGNGGVLRIPEGLTREEAAVVPGTDGRKMSKSYGNVVEPFAPEKELRKSIMGIKTDSTPLEAPKNPATCNVFALLKLFCSPAEVADIEGKYRAGGTGYGDFKKLLFEKTMQRFEGPRKRHVELENNLDYVESVLRGGRDKARATASEMLSAVKHACGLLP